MYKHGIKNMRISMLNKFNCFCIHAVILIFLASVFPILPITGVNAAVQTTFFVSSAGSDGNAGNIEAPFATISKARDAVRNINSNMSGDITVYLRGGEYALDSAIIFNESDSGTNGYNVIYQAYQDEKPVISGGVRLTSKWTQEGSTNVWKTTVNNVDNFRQLYINGNRAKRAATENILEGLGFGGDNDGIYVNADNIPSFSRPGDLEFICGPEWKDYHVLVEDVRTAGDKSLILFKMPNFSWQNIVSPKISGSSKFILENAKELLDTPGEWYFDKDTKELYYMPLPSESINGADVVIPKTDKFLEISGSSIDNKVQNIQFKGLTFCYSTWLRPSMEGAVNLQTTSMTDITGAFGYLLPASIEINKAKNLRFERNVLSQMGGSGINIVNAVNDIYITGNIFSDISSSAISVGHWNHDVIDAGEEVCLNVHIQNNLIRDVAREYKGSVAITAYYVEAIDISHNYIIDVAYSGISVGWGWENDSIQTCKNNSITNNKIINVAKERQDAGFIYTLGKQPGSVISGNYCKGLTRTHPSGGIYHDAGTRYYTDTNNVLDITMLDSLAVHFNAADDVTIDNLYTTTGNIVQYNSDNNVITNVKIYPEGKWPVEAMKIIKESGLEHEYADLLKGMKPLSKLERHPDISAKSNAFEENNGEVMFESDDYHKMVPGNTGVSWIGCRIYNWGYSGESALHGHSAIIDTGLETTGPELRYNINFKEIGDYYVYIRGMQTNNGDSIHVGLDGNAVTNDSEDGLTGWGNSYSWQSKHNGLGTVIHVKKPGIHTFSIWLIETGTVVDKIWLTKEKDAVADGNTSIDPRIPSATIINVSDTPGVIQAEYYNNGGEGVAYHDTTPGNSDNAAYRNDDVEISGEGNYIVSLESGEWLKYTVNTPMDNKYTFSFSAANNGSASKLKLYDGETVLGEVDIPVTTGSAVKFVDRSILGIQLAKGPNLLKLENSGTGNFSIDSFEITEALTPMPVIGLTVPGTIQAIQFDEGGEGIGYHDTTQLNEGDNQTRGDGPDVWGDFIGSFGDNEWLAYTLDIPIAGDYIIDFIVCCGNNDGKMKLCIDNGIKVTDLGERNVPNTGSSSGGWTKVSVRANNLSAGKNRITVKALGWFSFQSFEVKEADTRATLVGAAADSYVRMGGNAGSNFGSDVNICTKDSADNNYDRQGFLKFDLSSLNLEADKVEKVTLWIYCNSLPDVTAPVYIYSVADDSWTESGINGNNKPATVSTLADKTLSSVGLVEFDVTDFVKAEISGDKIVSLSLWDQITAIKQAIFNSKENTGMKPVLEILTIKQ